MERRAVNLRKIGLFLLFYFFMSGWLNNVAFSLEPASTPFLNRIDEIKQGAKGRDKNNLVLSVNGSYRYSKPPDYYPNWRFGDWGKKGNISFKSGALTDSSLDIPKGNVGWVWYKGMKPVSIILDLKKDYLIEKIILISNEYNRYIALPRVDFFARSSDENSFTFLGSQEGYQGSTSPAIHTISQDAHNYRARYIKLELIPKGGGYHIVISEVKIIGRKMDEQTLILENLPQRKLKGNAYSLFNIVRGIIKSKRWNPMISEACAEDVDPTSKEEEFGPKVKKVKAVRIISPPIIDGKLNDPCWQEASKVTDFVLLNKPKELAKEQTKVYVAYDNDKLYIAFKCYESQMDKLKAVVRERDSNRLFKDDSAEIFLDTNHNRYDFYHFAANALGTQWDSRADQGGSVDTKSWGTDWEIKTSIADEFWIAEFAIPFYGLSITPDVSSTWGINFTRERRAGSAELSSWSPTFGGFYRPTYFGELVRLEVNFTKYCWLVNPDLDDIKVSKDGFIEADINAEIKNQTDIPSKIAIEGILVSPSNISYSDSQKVRFKKGEKKDISLKYKVKENGKYILSLTLRNLSDNSIVYRSRSTHLIASAPLNLTLIAPSYRNTIFATQDLAQVEAMVEINLSKEERGDLGLEVVLKKDKATLASKRIRPLPSKKIDVNFDAENLSIGDYLITAVLFDEEDKEVFRVTKSLRKVASVDSEIRINENNVLLVNGTPFFPIGIFGVSGSRFEKSIPDICRELAQAGFNTIGEFSGNYENVFREVLQSAGANNLKMVVNPKGYPGLLGVGFDFAEKKEEKKKIISEWMPKYRNNPAILSWLILDEPENKGIFSLKGLSQGVKFLKEIDPYHPILSNHNTVDGAYSYAKIGADILSVDPYPGFDPKGGPCKPLDMISSFIDAGRKAVKDKRPVWAILQVSGWYNQGERHPTIEEVRAMTYLAITHGAKGIFYYGLGPAVAGFSMWAHPQYWARLKVLISELNYLTPVFLSPDRQGKILLFPEKSGIATLLKEYNKESYLIAVNSQPKPIEVEFQLVNLPRVSKLYVLAENRVIKVNRNRFKDKFGGYGVHIYTTAGDIPKLDYRIKVLSPIVKREKIFGPDYALAKHGAMAKVSSARGSMRKWTGGLIDGHRGDPYWRPSTKTYPQWIETWFSYPEKMINKVIVARSPLTGEPLTYQLQYWDKKQGGWVTIDQVKDNTERPIVHNFSPITTSKIRLWILGGDYISEIEAYGPKK